MTKIELLAPARDLETGVAAIDSGADAVYIGAPRFGARAQVGNSLADIALLVEHAHTYWAHVYVTVNTLLHDDELPEAIDLVNRLYELEVDAAIIQDVGLLECDLPPIPLIASTQMHNHTPERVAFLERVGIKRAILARELSLDQIRAIRARTSMELETFVHGALCVSYSGQCYLSYAIGGRSGNRGECAQPCRRKYSLVDRGGRTLAANRHLLSLRDLNLTDYLGDLLDAGVTSFKIEGRLKDRAYVVNVVSWYRQHLDALLGERGAPGERGLRRASSGRATIDLTPDVSKTFNRGYTPYFIRGRAALSPPGALDSPKMVGEDAGRVVSVQGNAVVLDTPLTLVPGDGLCWFDESGELGGAVVSAVQEVEGLPGRVQVRLEKTDGLAAGRRISRNHDHAFLRRLERARPARKIAVRLRLESVASGLLLHAEDEDGNCALASLPADLARAADPDRAESTTRKQLSKMGGTPFSCAGLDLAWDRPYFLPVADLNALRRDALDLLAAVRQANRPVERGGVDRNDAPYPETSLTFRANALNRQAVAFYRRHGVSDVPPAAEAEPPRRLSGQAVMRTRYCLKHQLGYCGGAGHKTPLDEPLTLVDEAGHRYRLRFDCAACEMEVIF